MPCPPGLRGLDKARRVEDASVARAMLGGPVRGVAALMAHLGAEGHATFGGRLAADATGFPAAAMAKTHAGDWRSWVHPRG
jgi:menaquinone-dependent protoporphyrinogen oxidase